MLLAQIDIDGADADLAEGSLVTSLYRWLLEDPELRGAAVVSVGAERTQSGAMGGALELVNVVLSNTVALGGLLVAVASWRESRAVRPSVHIRCDGVRVGVDGPSPEAVQRVAEALTGQYPARTHKPTEDDSGSEGQAPLS